MSQNTSKIQIMTSEIRSYPCLISLSWKINVWEQVETLKHKSDIRKKRMVFIDDNIMRHVLTFTKPDTSRAARLTLF